MSSVLMVYMERVRIFSVYLLTKRPIKEPKKFLNFSDCVGKTLALFLS